MFFRPKFKIGDKVRLTTTYYWNDDRIRVKAGTTFIITEVRLRHHPLVPMGTFRTLISYTCYSCLDLPCWLPQHHLKIVKQPIHLTKSTTATKPSLLARLTNWLLY